MKIDAIIEISGRTVAWLSLGMVVITCTVVVLRYGFDTGAIALQESVTYMHALVFMIGLSYALKHDRHVRVDLLFNRLSRRSRQRINLIGHVGCLLYTSDAADE